MNIEEARRVRQDRAEVLHGLRDQRLWAEDILALPPDCMRECKLDKFLLAIRNVGERRIVWIMGEYSPHTKLRNVRGKGRESLINRLPPAARKKT